MSISNNISLPTTSWNNFVSGAGKGVKWCGRHFTAAGKAILAGTQKTIALAKPIFKKIAFQSSLAAKNAAKLVKAGADKTALIAKTNSRVFGVVILAAVAVAGVVLLVKCYLQNKAAARDAIPAALPPAALPATQIVAQVDAGSAASSSATVAVLVAAVAVQDVEAAAIHDADERKEDEVQANNENPAAQDPISSPEFLSAPASVLSAAPSDEAHDSALAADIGVSIAEEAQVSEDVAIASAVVSSAASEEVEEEKAPAAAAASSSHAVKLSKKQKAELAKKSSI